MVRLLDRGTDARRAVIKSLLEQPSQTEDELIEETELSKSTVRNALQLMLKVEMASSKRRKRDDGKRGPGPIEYWLTERGSPETLESELRKRAGGVDDALAAEVHHLGGKQVTVRAQQRRLFVLVKSGTNDAVTTKDGRMLRVEEHVLPKVQEQYRRVLRGTELESVALDEYFTRFYPEYNGKRERPVL